jgi:hypothetical protein
MSARLDSLIARNLSGSTALHARTPSLFEPASQSQGPLRAGPIQPADNDWMTNAEEIITGESHDSRTPSPPSLATRTEGTLNPSRKSLAPFDDAHDQPQLPRVDQLSLLEPPVRCTSAAQPPSAMPLLAESLPPAKAHRSANERPAHPSVTVGVATSTLTPKLGPPATREDRKTDQVPLIGKVISAVSKSEREREEPSWLPTRTTDRKPLRPAGMMLPSSSQTAPEPTIQVTIGRIEIRAEREPSTLRKAAPTPPVMALDEYLRQKNARAGQ